MLKRYFFSMFLIFNLQYPMSEKIEKNKDSEVSKQEGKQFFKYIKEGKLESCKEMAAKNKSVVYYIMDHNKDSALHQAILFNKLSIIKWLIIDCELNPFIKNGDNLTPLCFAFLVNDSDTLSFLSRRYRLKKARNVSVQNAAKDININTFFKQTNSYLQPFLQTTNMVKDRDHYIYVMQQFR